MFAATSSGDGSSPKKTQAAADIDGAVLAIIRGGGGVWGINGLRLILWDEKEGNF